MAFVNFKIKDANLTMTLCVVCYLHANALRLTWICLVGKAHCIATAAGESIKKP